MLTQRVSHRDENRYPGFERLTMLLESGWGTIVPSFRSNTSLSRENFNSSAVARRTSRIELVNFFVKRCSTRTIVRAEKKKKKKRVPFPGEEPLNRIFRARYLGHIRRLV